MKQRGLTLLEVMVALVIFALTSTAIMKAAGDHLSGITQLKEVTFATWVANNRLTQISLENSWPIKNDQKGSVEMMDRTWYWQQRTLKTGDDDFLAVEVSVGLDENFQDSITTVTSYFSNPEPATL